MTATKDPEAWARLGGWITDRRKQLGMDQRQLAEAAGVSENTISNYERGRVPARGKMPAGYLRVEKALKFGKGSLQGVLDGYVPSFEVEGSMEGRLVLREPEEVDDPLLRAVVTKVKEALELDSLCTLFVDLAARWNASEETIERFQAARSDLLADMFSSGRGPVEVQRFHEAQAEGKVSADAMDRRPELGWMALAVELPDVDPPDGIGDILRKARYQSGMEFDDLSKASKVPVRVIQLIEAGTFDFAGAYMHAPVYIELMADALGIEAAPLVNRFKTEHAAPASSGVSE